MEVGRTCIKEGEARRRTGKKRFKVRRKNMDLEGGQKTKKSLAEYLRKSLVDRE